MALPRPAEKHSPTNSPYVRLRRLHGDPRLYVTQDGATTSGHLAEAHTQITGAEVPYLKMALTSSDPTLYDNMLPDVIRIRADRILLADVHELDRHVSDAEERALIPEHRFRQFLTVLDQLRRWMSEAVPPPCGHEDVIETPELGEATVRGVCMWCPAPLLRLNDEWIAS